MMAKRTVRHPCKCNRVDPKHTAEEQGDGWTRYVCSSCGKAKYEWRRGAAKDPNEKGL